MARDDTARRVEEFAAEFDEQCKPITAKYHEQIARHKDAALAAVSRAGGRLVVRGLLLGLLLGFMLGVLVVLAGQCWGAG